MAVLTQDKIICGDCREVLAGLDAGGVHCCVTSPPYWGLRKYAGEQGAVWGGDAECGHEWGEKHEVHDERETTQHGKTRTTDRCYGESSRRFDGNHQKHVAGQVCVRCGAWRGALGLEPTPEMYVSHIVECMAAVRRVLRDDGTLWLNLGDSYAGSCRGADAKYANQQLSDDSLAVKPDWSLSTLKAKDLCMMPFRVFKALQEPHYEGRIKREQDRVWLAAMIDAEGCMFIHKRKAGQSNGQGYFRKSDSFGAGLEVANTSEAIVQHCLDIAGLGSICHQDKEGKNKRRKQRLFRWNLRSNQCRDVIKEIYPYLIAKQHEARLVLGCPSSGKDAAAAHQSVIALHNGNAPTIDFKPPESCHQPGWYLRSIIIWSKLNPMPESVTDRPTTAHEYVGLFSKSPRYYYDQDAIREAQKQCSRERAKYGWQGGTDDGSGGARTGSTFRRMAETGELIATIPVDGKRNKRTVWTIPTAPYKDAHFATFPPKLVEPMVKAGCPDGGLVLDPFAGAGTVGLVAKQLGRNYILIDAAQDYCDMAEKRIGSWLC